MTTTITTVDLIDERFSKNRQGYDYTRYRKIHTESNPSVAVKSGEVVIKSRLHIDMFYSEQSNGSVELWTPAGWTSVVTYTGTDLHAHFSFTNEHVRNGVDLAKQDCQDASDVMESVATKILSLKGVSF
jgi:hypothetical protein